MVKLKQTMAIVRLLWDAALTTGSVVHLQSLFPSTVSDVQVQHVLV